MAARYLSRPFVRLGSAAVMLAALAAVSAPAWGLDLLQEGSYIPREKEYAAKAVLRAAAMTYVWAAIASLLSLLRLAILVKGNRRRD